VSRVKFTKTKWFYVPTAIVAIVLIPQLLPSFWVTLATEMLVYAILAMSLNILLGYTGLPPFGHTGYFGVAAYAVAILSTRCHLGFFTSGASGILLSTVVAALFGLLVAHSFGVYFLMITFALGMCLWGLAYRWSSLTGGDNGIANIPRPEIWPVGSFTNEIAFFYLTLLVFGLVVLAVYWFIRSPFGLTLFGIRESESRMRSLGYNTWLHKYLSYVVAGMFAGVAGSMWAYYSRYVSPTDLDMMACIKPFLMVILGGTGTMVGPIVGAGIIVFLEHFISSFTQRWLMIQGIIFIIIVFYAPTGLVNVVKNMLKKEAEGDRGR
jgi:branched-chain amino acid transport system permease protein